MSVDFALVKNFLSENNPIILVNIVQTKGSTPRDKDGFMLVSMAKIIGTIGGGALEYRAIERARKMLRDGENFCQLDFALGESNKQCCGGRVRLNLRLVDDNIAQNLLKKIKSQQEKLPNIYLFGAGHVGRALARLLEQMPYKTLLIDSRANISGNIGTGANLIINPFPESVIKQAEPKSAFVIFTHDHELDFLLAYEALERGDAKYIGMIGSKTKCAKFSNFYRKNNGKKENLANLTCPIGANYVQHIGDKRPEIIAALTLGEIIVNLADCGRDYGSKAKKQAGT